ncbi:heavy-metal-associated domain-containing protein [Hymenobacter koreensis]|uniref:HMA domain-containing protein n=1 Tax=Hymenobacter koreensis TaxID=1084523 RepID=A0ABP8IU97_9BACT
MQTLRFKTNINCGGCVKAVTPFLNDAVGLEGWEVDTASPDKTLTVQADDVTAEDVIAAVQEAGFSIKLARAVPA